MMSRHHRHLFLLKLNQSGQLIVEYVLLLVIATSIAMMIRIALVKGGETPGDSGALMQKWYQITQTIGKDDPNKRSQ